MKLTIRIQFDLYLPDRKPGRGPRPAWRHDWGCPGQTSVTVWGFGIFGDHCEFAQL